MPGRPGEKPPRIFRWQRFSDFWSLSSDLRSRAPKAKAAGSKMASCEFPPGAAFEISLKCLCFGFRPEGNCDLKAPRAVFRTVWTCSAVMLAKPFLQVL